MIVVDTSVAVPVVADWHELHEVAVPAAHGAGITAHARLEAYSVLTRLPPPYGQPGAAVGAVLAARFPVGSVLTASPALQRSIVERLVAAGIEGGSAYDAVIALVVASHDGELLTADQRAARTYEALGVRYRLLGG